ncbi:hypothetical protein ACIRL0_00545 [Streptomyces sp. NPDC102365]|uniref:hypothetical protein n=1 Tax=Streptomyces sp. NPDC102365 TaxID=3366162 RepID=UPI00382F3E24
MTREERHALLLKHGGPQIFDEMREWVRVAPEPPDEVVAKLRRIFAGRGDAIPKAEPDHDHFAAVPA